MFIRYFNWLSSRGISRVTFCVLIILSLSCSSTSSPKTGELTSKKTIVVFVPGYKGSLLHKRGSEENIWINLEEVLFGSDNLSLNTSQYSSIEGIDLEHGEILERISIIPPLVSYNVYGECLDKLKTSWPDHYEIRAFSYDWRRGADYNGEKLVEFMKSIRSQSSSPIKIIAHSMGGLVGTMAIRSNSIDNEDLVDTIVYFGTPFQGVVESFMDMNNEKDPILFNKILLDRKAYNSFESAFDLMPAPKQGRFDPEGRFSNEEVIYDIEKWDKYSWGLFSFRNEVLFNSEGIRTYIKSNLERSKYLHELINSEVNEGSSFSQMRILNFVGVGTPTLGKGKYDKNLSNGLSFDGDELLEDGDGVVTKESASTPKSFEKAKELKESQLPLGHMDFCLNEGVLGEIVDFLSMQEGDSRGY